MKIRALKVEALTSDGWYGFFCQFDDALNIIKGWNSTGKSTLVNSMIYALGMEEIIGGRNEKVLPYCLKDYLESDGGRLSVAEAFTHIEIQNGSGDIVTLKRAIKSESKGAKLIEVHMGKCLSDPQASFSVEVRPTFIHDGGSAKDEGAGYFRFLESFLGMSLPLVASTSGAETKLYIQTVFSALLVEQKRGWTDYIAGTPYFAIRDVKTKVVEYLLGLEVFENNLKKGRLDADSIEIAKKWESARYKVKLVEDSRRVYAIGIPARPVTDFNEGKSFISPTPGDSSKSIFERIVELNSELDYLSSSQEAAGSKGGDVVYKVKEEIGELAVLLSLFDACSTEIGLKKQMISDYQKSLDDVLEDLRKNKLARKLREFGAEYNLSLAKDSCPTCHQIVDDSLLLPETYAQPMSIDENISYLASQQKMLEKAIFSTKEDIVQQERRAGNIQAEISKKRAYLSSLKRDVPAVGNASEANLRRKIQVEDEIYRLKQGADEIGVVLKELAFISASYEENLKMRASLPKSYYSIADQERVREFLRKFKTLARDFEYKSAAIDEIDINLGNLLPILSGLELREINTDIKADSSASDFVRLIWSYLLSLYAASGGAQQHPGLVVFDEPGQHSMAMTSIRALFIRLSNMQGLQSIVAASFDENEDYYRDATNGISHHLIEVKGKLLRKF